MSQIKTTDLLKALVWLFVIVWCIIPAIWVVGAWLSSLAMPQPPIAPIRPGEQQLLLQLQRSILMFCLFCYSIWCASGVVCGLGADRFISVVGKFWRPE